LVGWIGRETEAKQGKEGYLEPGLAGGAVDQCGHGHGGGAGGGEEIEAFLGTSATGDHVLGHENALAGREGEAAADDEAVILFLGEDEADAELAGEFLSNHEPSHGRGENGIAGRGLEFG
jgi:hypothetical protein